MLRALVGATLLLAACGGDIAEPAVGDGGADRDGTPVGGCAFEPAPAGPRVRVIYLLPSDATFDPVVAANLEVAAREAQLWLKGAMPGGGTFRLGDPVVELIQTDHPTAFYATNVAAGCDDTQRFQCNVTGDGLELTGGSAPDPDNLWLFFVAADPACGQLNYGLGGVAVSNGNDLRGLAGQTLTTCDGSPPEAATRCRWVGGFGLLLMGALDMPRQPGCLDEDMATPCDGANILERGYVDFPAATLTPEQIGLLEASPFIGDVELPDCSIDCVTVATP